MKKMIALFLLVMTLCSLMPGALAEDKFEGQDKPTLRALLINVAIDYNEDDTAKSIEAFSGYKIIYDMLPSDAAMDKLNLIMASEEDYDFVVIGGDVARVMEYANAGALVDIAPYLKDYPNLNAAMNEYERSTFSVGDSLFAIGMEALSFGGYGEVRQLPFIRQDWLDALGLQMPATVEEFTEVLRAFKTYDNGSGNPVIPLTLRSEEITVNGLMGAFGVTHEWMEVDGKLINRVEDPRYLNYLAYLRDLYAEGLLDAEFPANKSANINEKFSSGVAGVSYHGYWDVPTLSDTLEQVQPSHVLGFVPPLVGENGMVGVGTTVGGFDRISFIPKVTKNLEHVLNLFEIKLEMENFVDAVIGKEGIDYTIEDGEYWPILPTFFEHRSWAVNFTTGRYSDVYPTLWMCRAKKDVRQWACWEVMNRNEAIAAVNITSEFNKAPAMPATAKYKQSLDQMARDYHINMIAGTVSFDDYPTFLEEWYAAGGRDMVEEYNVWWAAFKAE